MFENILSEVRFVMVLGIYGIYVVYFIFCLSFFLLVYYKFVNFEFIG